MIELLQWIEYNNYVRNKDSKWYKPADYPRVYLTHEQLIELYESTHL